MSVSMSSSSTDSNSKPVKAIILAAGYGTRLERDILSDESGAYSSLIGVPKPLIPVGGIPLIVYWIGFLRDACISNIYVVVNEKFYHLFEEWARANDFPLDDLVNDGSTSNDNRLGACCCIELVVKEKNLYNDDVLIIAGDTLFTTDFHLGRDVLERHRSLSTEAGSSVNLITYYYLKDHQEVAKRGILELDERNEKVVCFLEKPKPEETTSNKATPALYLYSSAAIKQLGQFVEEAEELKNRDAPGMFLRWLYKKDDIYATPIGGRFDIGGLSDYIVANDYFHANRKEKA